MVKQKSVPKQKIPHGVIDRLPIYLNCLVQLRNEGYETVSSQKLGELTEINPAEIRRDLSFFGSFGKKGVGYNVARMIKEFSHIIGSDEPHRIILVGAGNLGNAIASYDGLSKHDFKVTAIFDNDPEKIDGKIGRISVKSIDTLNKYNKKAKIKIGIIAVPENAAQQVANQLIQSGVTVILNYTPTLISVPSYVHLHNTDPVKELLHTLYYLREEKLDRQKSKKKN